MMTYFICYSYLRIFVIIYLVIIILKTKMFINFSFYSTRSHTFISPSPSDIPDSFTTTFRVFDMPQQFFLE